MFVEANFTGRSTLNTQIFTKYKFAFSKWKKSFQFINLFFWVEMHAKLAIVHFPSHLNRGKLPNVAQDYFSYKKKT